MLNNVVSAKRRLPADPLTATALGGILMVAIILRVWVLQLSYHHPDEDIAVGVARHVVTERTLDTNWAHGDVPEWTRVPQFNFSAYNLSAALVMAATGSEAREDAGRALRILRGYSALLGCAAVVLTFLLGRRMFGPWEGLGAAALAAVNPLLFQDSFYARPETFTTTLTLLVLLLCAAPGENRRAVFAAAVVAGLLIATKISSIALLPLLLLPYESPRAGTFKAYAAHAIAVLPLRIPLVLAGVALGVICGVPYIFSAPDAFWDGLRALNAQYTAGYWPHGLMEGTTAERLVYALRYFASTAGGPVLVCAALGAGWAAREARFWSVAVFLCALVFLLRFGTYAAFFERNLSHVVPVFLLFASFFVMRLAARVLPARSVGRVAAMAAAIAFVAAPAAATSFKLLFTSVAGRDDERLRQERARIAAAFNLTNAELGWDHTFENVERHLQNPCQPVLANVPFPGDPVGDRALARLKDRYGIREVGRFQTTFADVPPSTLHVYFTPPVVFLHRPADDAQCAAHDRFIAPSRTGAALPVVQVGADPGWKERATPQPKTPPVDGETFFASWSGNDSHTGRLRIEAAVDGTPAVVIPYLTGYVTDQQTITVRDARSGVVIQTLTPAPSVDWSFIRVALPAGTAHVVIEAVDGGADWGAWHAVGLPHALKD